MGECVCIYSVCTVFVYILMYGYILYGPCTYDLFIYALYRMYFVRKEETFSSFSFLFSEKNEAAITRQVSLEALFCTDLTYGV